MPEIRAIRSTSGGSLVTQICFRLSKVTVRATEFHPLSRLTKILRIPSLPRANSTITQLIASLQCNLIVSHTRMPFDVHHLCSISTATTTKHWQTTKLHYKIKHKQKSTTWYMQCMLNTVWCNETITQQYKQQNEMSLWHIEQTKQYYSTILLIRNKNHKPFPSIISLDASAQWVGLAIMIGPDWDWSKNEKKSSYFCLLRQNDKTKQSKLPPAIAVVATRDVTFHNRTEQRDIPLRLLTHCRVATAMCFTSWLTSNHIHTPQIERLKCIEVQNRSLSVESSRV